MHKNNWKLWLIWWILMSQISNIPLILETVWCNVQGRNTIQGNPKVLFSNNITSV